MKFKFTLAAMATAGIIFSTAAAAKIQTAHSGNFIAYNDTDKTVTITVGNFFPTPYVISPHSKAWIFVSTDNQNIHIKSIG